MKAQYDAAYGAGLKPNTLRIDYMKLVSTGSLLIVLAVGCIAGFDMYQRFYKWKWQEEYPEAVVLVEVERFRQNRPVEITAKGGFSTESFVYMKENINSQPNYDKSEDFLSNVEEFVATLDKRGLIITVTHYDGSASSITESSSDGLKSFVNIILMDVLNTVRTEASKSEVNVNVPVMLEDSDEDIWRWHPTSDNSFRIHYLRGQWFFNGWNLPESRDSDEESNRDSSA